ncbi:MAG: acyl-CoA synthetase [Proteobacteria bacterium]|nr:acyl-CoA synthetase [Pseudomonadota bacterium]
MTAAVFLAEAVRLAAILPEAKAGPDATAGPVLNLCADRYSFALGFAACLLRGRVSLLTGDRSPAWLAGLAERFPGLVALSDRTAAVVPVVPMPIVPISAVAPPPEGCELAGVAVPTIPADRLAAIVFTSGSTGEPVGHRKCWGALAARSRDAGRRFGLLAAQPAAVVGTVPPQHMYGFETTVLLPFHAAASSWCGPAFYPVDIAAALAACAGPRVLVTTPLQLRALLGADSAPPPLARVISATAPLDPTMAEAAERRWGTEVWEIFGATEVGSIASRRTVAGPTWRCYPRVRLDPMPKPGASDAAPSDAAPSDIAPSDMARSDVPRSDVPRSDAGPVGLAADPVAASPVAPGSLVVVRAPFSAPFPLSDRLELLDPIRFRLLGRNSDMVKLGGRRASLAGLTRVLTGIAGVEDGIFIAPDDLETRPTARLLVFAVAPDLSAEAILAALRTRIDPLFLPRRVIRLDRLPRDPLGKLPARALAGLQTRPAGGETP